MLHTKCKKGRGSFHYKFIYTSPVFTFQSKSHLFVPMNYFSYSSIFSKYTTFV